MTDLTKILGIQTIALDPKVYLLDVYCQHNSVSIHEMRGKSRRDKIVSHRVNFARSHYPFMTLKEIASAINRHHSTIHHYIHHYESP